MPSRKPYPPADLPWWKSKIIMGIVVAIFCNLAARFGLTDVFAPADQAELVRDLVELFGLIAGGGTAIGARIRQKHAPPITRI